MVEMSLPVAGKAAVITRHAEDLREIARPGVNICVLERCEPELSRFVHESLVPLELKLSWSGTDFDVDKFLRDLPKLPGFEAFRRDVARWVTSFREIAAERRMQIKLHTISTNLCERFHADRIKLRLLCSYAGPGTEWLEDQHINRDRLGPKAGGLADEDSGLMRPSAVIHQLEPMSVGLLKGECWPGNEGRGVVHRSPRICLEGLRRVLFKIDAGSTV